VHVLLQFLSHCKRGVRIVNVARGGLLDYEAVKEGLQSGTIGGMGLDVQWQVRHTGSDALPATDSTGASSDPGRCLQQEPYDPEDFIAQHPKVVLTPHVAGVTELSYRSMAVDLAAAVRLAQRGQPPIRKMNQVSN
jgi:phosphoglycerate dehydrogenase-like enzyme